MFFAGPHNLKLTPDAAAAIQHLDLFVCLDKDVLTPQNTLGYGEVSANVRLVQRAELAPKL